MCLIQENIFRWLDIEFFKNRKNSKFCLTASLPDHIRKPRRQTKHRTAEILRHNNKLTSEICLLGFWWVWGLCTSLFLLSSIRLFFFFMQRNHIDVLIFPINTFLEQRIYSVDATTSILKHLCYCRGIGQLQVRYFECKIERKAHWSGRGRIDIYTTWWMAVILSFNL